MSQLTPNAIFPDSSRLDEILERFAQARVAIVGDFFLDQYLVIDPSLAEPSVETGLVAHQVVATRQSPGAAGTVANNLASLEVGQLHAIGVIGDDGNGYLLRRELERRGASTDGLFSSSLRFTPTYTKPMFLDGNSEREGERVDIINRTPTPSELEDRIVAEVERIADSVDAVVLLDQVARPNVGVLTERVRSAICKIAQKHPKTIFYGDSRAFIGEYVGILTKPNCREALTAVSMPPAESASDADASQAGERLFGRTGKPVFLTRGGNGMLVTTDEGQFAVPGIPVEGPLDICGAGDSATAGLVLALCSGASITQAAYMGNMVASRTVLQIGTTGTTTRDAIRSLARSLGI